MSRTKELLEPSLGIPSMEELRWYELQDLTLKAENNKKGLYKLVYTEENIGVDSVTITTDNVEGYLMLASSDYKEVLIELCNLKKWKWVQKESK